MSLSLLQNTTAMAPNGLTTPFQGSGGVSPYVYSVLGGGAGGTINSSTGVYTSPSSTGMDTIQVTDNSGATATAEILICNAIELVCDIIQNQMNLAQGRVFLWNQKIFQPTDQGLFIAVGVISCKPFGNSRQYSSGTNVSQIQSVNMQALLSIDAISRGPDARDRKEEIVMALKSFYAQAQQELNSFYIAPITTNFQNLSQIDGAAIPYRFNLSVMIQYMVTKTSSIPYMSGFTVSSPLTN